MNKIDDDNLSPEAKTVKALFGGWGTEQRAALTAALNKARRKDIEARREMLDEQARQLKEGKK